MADSDHEDDKLPLTFGVELEFLFGINRSQVCSDPVFYHLFPQFCTIDEDDDPTSYQDFDPTADQHRCLLQAAKVLRNKGAELEVLLDPKANDDSFDKFSRWHLTKEAYVKLPSSYEELVKWSNGMVDDWKSWDFQGLELISPALPVPDINSRTFKPKGLVELTGYLKFLTQDHPPNVPYLFLAQPENASLHIHVGMQPEMDGQVDIPLEVLRHLAFICVLFEDVITLLHHPERHGYHDTKSYEHARPNRNTLLSVGQDHHVHNCKDAQGFSAEDAFIQIFSYAFLQDKPDRQALADLFITKHSHSGRRYTRQPMRTTFVNFSNIVSGDEEDKKTIEFRQHHGTLSPEDICQWVVFVTALVRAAERKARENPCDPTIPVVMADKIWQRPGCAFTMQQASKYNCFFARGTKKKRTLKELFDLLDLPIERRRYWWERAKHFQSEAFAGYRGRATCDVRCPNEPVRDAEGWGVSELDEPPWESDPVVAAPCCAFEMVRQLPEVFSSMSEISLPMRTVSRL